MDVRRYGAYRKGEADMFRRNFSAMGKSILGSALCVLLLLSACTFVVRPEGATGAATATPQEEATAGSDLVGPTWQWLQTKYSNNTTVNSSDPAKYTLQFSSDGTVAVQLDCNKGSGTYQVNGSSLTFGAIASTLMACPTGSQDIDFAKDLSAVASYTINNGHLFLALNADGGTMEFAPAGENGAATAQPSEEATITATAAATQEATAEATAAPTEEATVTATAEVTQEASAQAGGVLTGTTWLWSKTVISDVTTTPVDPSRYSISFNKDGTTSIKLDCNVARATFTLVDPNNLTINPILVTTKASCPADTQDTIFSQNLQDALSYTMADGALHLALKSGGVMELTEQK